MAALPVAPAEDGGTHPAEGGVSRRGKKRASDEADGARPSKRKRLGQASVFCMRELLRAVMKDGDVTGEERDALQNVAVLLSQVHGDQWVHMPESVMQEFSGSRAQRQKLACFLEKVANELKSTQMHFEVETVSARSTLENSLEFLAMDRVAWADGITSRELQAYCGPEVELDDPGWQNFLTKVTAVLPSQYMFRSRVRELINYYHYTRLTPGAAASCSVRVMPESSSAGGKPPTSLVQQALARMLMPGVRMAHSCIGATVKSVATFMLLTISIFVRAMTLMNRRFFCYTGPIGPAMGFFVLALFYRPTKRFLEFVVLIARLRAVLCLAGSNRVFGQILMPLVFVAKKFLRWNEESWMLGCSCEDEAHPSLLSLVPVRSAQLIAHCLRLLVGPGDGDGVFAAFADTAYLVLVFVFEAVFSFGIAEGLAMLVRWANEHMETRLIWMSLSLSRSLRERPAPAEQAPTRASGASSVSCAPSQRPDMPSGSIVSLHGSDHGSQGIADTIPAWREDGDWSLFDT